MFVTELLRGKRGFVYRFYSECVLMLVLMSPDFSPAHSAQKLSSGSPCKSLCPALEPYIGESSAG